MKMPAEVDNTIIEQKECETNQIVACNEPENDEDKSENNKHRTTKRKASQSSDDESMEKVHSDRKDKHSNTSNKKAKFQHGNYDRYYGYRNSKGLKDARLEVFKMKKELFKNKDILDIGCNDGFISIAIAKDLDAKSMTGIDIDQTLVGKANKNLRYHMKAISDPYSSENIFPTNVKFRYANYVLRDEALLGLEQPQFDVITCLSVTKWIHLNNGDDGLKLVFKRMFKQLRPGGILILEAQNWKSYKRRKALTESISLNFKNIKLYPQKFTEYLLGPEVGFDSVYELFAPKNISIGFRRPIQVFTKNLTVMKPENDLSEVKDSIDANTLITDNPTESSNETTNGAGTDMKVKILSDIEIIKSAEAETNTTKPEGTMKSTDTENKIEILKSETTVNH